MQTWVAINTTVMAVSTCLVGRVSFLWQFLHQWIDRAREVTETCLWLDSYSHADREWCTVDAIMQGPWLDDKDAGDAQVAL